MAMKKLICMFKNSRTGENVQHTFYGKKSDVDAEASMYMGTHLYMKLIDFKVEIVK
jgi:hypothetical protein